MPQCLIPNCPNDANNYLGVRLRRPAGDDGVPGNANWTRECNAHLCDEHADSGYIIDIRLTLQDDRNITTNTTAGGALITRTTPL